MKAWLVMYREESQGTPKRWWSYNRSRGYRLVKDSFRFWPAVFGPLWLLFRAPKLGVIALIVVSLWWALLFGISDAAGVNESIQEVFSGVSSIALFLIFGFEAGALERIGLQMERYQLRDVIVAPDFISAQHQVIQKWDFASPIFLGEDIRDDELESTSRLSRAVRTQAKYPDFADVGDNAKPVY